LKQRCGLDHVEALGKEARVAHTRRFVLNKRRVDFLSLPQRHGFQQRS
jgi:hypothetical protein